jgi:hypothetical protein
MLQYFNIGVRWTVLTVWELVPLLVWVHRFLNFLSELNYKTEPSDWRKGAWWDVAIQLHEWNCNLMSTGAKVGFNRLAQSGTYRSRSCTGRLGCAWSEEDCGQKLDNICDCIDRSKDGDTLLLWSCNNPHRPYDPYFSQWTRPDPMHILLREARYMNTGNISLYNYNNYIVTCLSATPYGVLGWMLDLLTTLTHNS